MALPLILGAGALGAGVLGMMSAEGKVANNIVNGYEQKDAQKWQANKDAVRKFMDAGMSFENMADYFSPSQVTRGYGSDLDMVRNIAWGIDPNYGVS